jgi:hypothetical protein
MQASSPAIFFRIDPNPSSIDVPLMHHRCGDPDIWQKELSICNLNFKNAAEESRIG